MQNLPPEHRPEEGGLPMYGRHGDNANEVKDGKELSRIVCGSTYLGQNFSAQDLELLRLQLKRMPLPDAESAAMLALTVEEEGCLALVGNRQDMQAMQYAAHLIDDDARRAAVQPQRAAGTAAQRPAAAQRSAAAHPLRQPAVPQLAAVSVNDVVIFKDRLGHELTGTVTKVGEVNATVDVKYDSGLVEVVAVPRNKLTKGGGAGAVASVSAKAAADEAARKVADTKRQRSESQYAEDDTRLMMDVVGDGRVRGVCNTTWIFEVIHEVNSKDTLAARQVWNSLMAAAAVEDEPILCVQTDNEFAPYMAGRAWTEGDGLDRPVMSMPGYGHMQKSIATGKLAFNELLWTKRLLEALQVLQNTPAYRRIMAARNIRTTNRHLIMEDFVLRVAWARRWLELDANTDELKWFLKPPPAGSHKYVDEWKTDRLVDPFGRTKPFSYGPEMLAAAQKMRSQREAAIGGGERAPVYCDSPAMFNANVGTTLDGVPAECAMLIDAAIRGMRARRKANHRVVKLECDRAEVSVAGLRHVEGQKQVLRQYFMAGVALVEPDLKGEQLRQALHDGRFDVESTHDAGIAAAEVALAEAIADIKRRALPSAPDGANICLQLLADHLDKGMPPFLMLYMQTRIRSEDTRSAVHERLHAFCTKCSPGPICRCPERHPWITAAKAIAVDMFCTARRYQKTCVMDTLQDTTILQIEDPGVVEILLTLKEHCYAVTVHGDSHSCEALSEHQEHECVQVLKRTLKTCWNSPDSKVRVASYAHVQAILEGWKTRTGKAGRQQAIGLHQHDKEEAALQAMLPAATEVVSDIMKAGAARHVPGDPSTPLRRPDLLYNRQALARNKYMSAGLSQQQAYSQKEGSKFPKWNEPVPSSPAIQRAANEIRAAAAAEKAQAKARQGQKLRATMEMSQSVFLNTGTADDLVALTSGQVGEKSELHWLVLQRYANGGTDKNQREAVVIFKDKLDLAAFIGKDFVPVGMVRLLPNHLGL